MLSVPIASPPVQILTPQSLLHPGENALLHIPHCKEFVANSMIDLPFHQVFVATTGRLSLAGMRSLHDTSTNDDWSHTGRAGKVKGVRLKYLA